jgi:hypothetical protein
MSPPVGHPTEGQEHHLPERSGLSYVRPAVARIVLAQPFALVLEALQRLLEASGQHIVARCDDVEKLETCLRRYAPEVALVDTLMAPDGDVASLVAAARRGLDGGRLVLLVPEVTPCIARDALAPGTNAPAPDAGVVVNVPPGSTVTNNTTTVVQSAPAAVSNRCVSGRSVRLVLSKKARKGSIRYVGSKGIRTVKARRSKGRLRATANFRGVSAEAGSYAAVTVREKMKSGGWREHARLFKLC